MLRQNDGPGRWIPPLYPSNQSRRLFAHNQAARDTVAQHDALPTGQPGHLYVEFCLSKCK
jgi:hypothetical protein